LFNLVEHLRQLLRLLVLGLALLVLGVELERLAEVAQRQLRVAHHVKAAPALEELGQAVVGVEGRRLLHLARRVHARRAVLLARLPQVGPLLAALLLAREHLASLAARLGGADAALALAVARPATLDLEVASLVLGRLPLGARAAVLGLPPADALALDGLWRSRRAADARLTALAARDWAVLPDLVAAAQATRRRLPHLVEARVAFAGQLGTRHARRRAALLRARPRTAVLARRGGMRAERP